MLTADRSTAGEDAPVNIVSLGAGFDTLFFRLVQAQKARVRFFEVDCAPIVDPKVAMLRGQRDGFFPTPASVLQEKIGEDGIAYRCKVAVSPNQDALASTYALLTCDLGDTTALEKKLETSGIDWTLPTLVLAECVVVRLRHDDCPKVPCSYFTFFVVVSGPKPRHKIAQVALFAFPNRNCRAVRSNLAQRCIWGDTAAIFFGQGLRVALAAYISDCA